MTFTAVNVRSATIGVKLGVLFAAAKLLALAFIITIGIWYAFKGNLETFHDPWANMATTPGPIALATIDAYFAYTGWSVFSPVLFVDF